MAAVAVPAAWLILISYNNTTSRGVVNMPAMFANLLFAVYLATTSTLGLL